MSPLAHLVGSWLVAAAVTDNPHDRKLVTLARILPDADGLGVVADVTQAMISGQENTFHYYQQITNCCCTVGRGRWWFRYCSRASRKKNHPCCSGVS